MEWNVAPTTFRSALGEVTCLLDDGGLPFFDALRDPTSMIEAALKAGSEATFVEYLVSEGSIDTLAEFLQALQRGRPPLYDTERRRMAQLAAGAPLELDRAAFVRIADVLIANDLGHLLAPAPAVDDGSAAGAPLEGRLILSTPDLQAELRRGKAAALAAVEVVEGAPRSLRRSRRKPRP